MNQQIETCNLEIILLGKASEHTLSAGGQGGEGWPGIWRPHPVQGVGA